MGYRWNIYLVNLDPVIGSEQGKTRPVLVISDDDINSILPVLNSLPTTSYKQGIWVFSWAYKIVEEKLQMHAFQINSQINENGILSVKLPKEWAEKDANVVLAKAIEAK